MRVTIETEPRTLCMFDDHDKTWHAITTKMSKRMVPYIHTFVEVRTAATLCQTIFTGDVTKHRTSKHIPTCQWCLDRLALKAIKKQTSAK